MARQSHIALSVAILGLCTPGSAEARPRYKQAVKSVRTAFTMLLDRRAQQPQTLLPIGNGWKYNVNKKSKNWVDINQPRRGLGCARAVVRTQTALWDVPIAALAHRINKVIRRDPVEKRMTFPEFLKSRGFRSPPPAP